ncbi:MAG: STAS domain-containing protein, partial [Parvularculaceae bacterium]|nr:STAS domain-containing protein [Parvularculaceae bacterium]
ALYLTPVLHDIPKATLAATIIVAALSLVDIKAPLRVWRISRADGFAMAATIFGALFLSIETGLVAGLVSALALHLKRTAAPHAAIVGQAPGTEHFRNVDRHKVATSPLVLSLRVDESLYFANSRYLEDMVARLVAERPALRHVVLLCSAVNHIDASGIRSLEEINRRLDGAGLSFHLSEVKGPVMDRLVRAGFLDILTGRVFLTQFGAMSMLDPDLARATLAAAPEPVFEDERKGA